MALPFLCYGKALKWNTIAEVIKVTMSRDHGDIEPHVSLSFASSAVESDFCARMKEENVTSGSGGPIIQTGGSLKSIPSIVNGTGSRMTRRGRGSW